MRIQKLLFAIVCVAVGFAMGRFTASTAENETNIQIEQALRSLDCSKAAIIKEFETPDGGTCIIFQVPDPEKQAGLGADVECLKQQMKKFIEQRNGRPVCITALRIVPRASIMPRYDTPDMAMLEVRFNHDSS